MIGWFVLRMVIGAAGGGSGGNALINVVAIIADIIFGAEGNSWRETNLASRGFEQVDTVTAANPEAAIALHLKGANAER